MVPNMKVTGRRIKLKARAGFSTSAEMSTRAIGSTIWPMALERINMLMVRGMKVAGVMISNMDLDRKSGMMDRLIVENTNMG